MSNRAAITLLRPRQEVERLWRSPEYRSDYVGGRGAAVSFTDAPGDRGTEIHVELKPSGLAAKLPLPLRKLANSPSQAKVKDELRRFKQRVETGEIPRSEGSPEGERAARKLKQRAAQPLPESELEKAGG
jgi:uncharacterized membrane protein